EVEIGARRPRTGHVERRDEAERAAVHVVGRRRDLVVDLIARAPDVGQRLAHDRVEHLGRHPMLVAGDDRKLREADEGDVAELARSRLMSDACGASGSPVGRKYWMSSCLPSRSPSGFHTACTRMPMRTSSALHSWMRAKIETSAPSSATEAAT